MVIGQDCVEPLQALRNAGDEVMSEHYTGSMLSLMSGQTMLFIGIAS